MLIPFKRHDYYRRKLQKPILFVLDGVDFRGYMNILKRALILPHEVIREMRQNEQIILMQGSPSRCGCAIYFRRKEMLAAAAKNRFAPQKKN